MAKKAKASPKATPVAPEEKDDVWNGRPVPLWMKEGSSVLDKDVTIANIRVTTPDHKTELISGCRFQLVAGRRYGLFGKNGIGKTTLLNMISSYELEEFPKKLRVIHITQESDMIHMEQTPLEVVMASDEEHQYLLDQEEKLTSLLENEDEDGESIQKKLELVYMRLEDIGEANQREGRASRILEGLQFSPEMMRKRTRDLSGGWRMRVALASALFITPDVLLLDEPTNHLDFPAVLWLETFLKQYENTLVIVSHDRVFLDNVITDVIDFRDKALHYYKGDYTSFDKVRKQELASARSSFDKQQRKIDELKEFVQKNSFVEVKAIKIQFQDQEPLDHKLVEIIDMVFSVRNTNTKFFQDFAYDPGAEHLLLKNVNLSFDVGDRVGVLGANGFHSPSPFFSNSTVCVAGVGKSTLIKLILGQLSPLRGKCRLNPEARVALFTQHHLDQLDLDVTPFEYLSAKFPLAKAGSVRGFLCGFGISIEAVTLQKIGTLSGGQKSRVAFAVLNWTKPHLIIMVHFFNPFLSHFPSSKKKDEPTNHLDLETIDSLLEALSSFRGGLIVVSHDQYFLSRACLNVETQEQTLWAVDDRGKVSVLQDLQEAKAFSYKYNVQTADMKKKGKLYST